MTRDSLDHDSDGKKGGNAAAPVEVLLLRGYVPKGAEIISYGRVATSETSPGHFEYTEVPATLGKLKKGSVHTLPAEEAKALIKRGAAVRPDEATDNHLIQAGLMRQEPVIEDDDD